MDIKEREKKIKQIQSQLGQLEALVKEKTEESIKLDEVILSKQNTINEITGLIVSNKEQLNILEEKVDKSDKRLIDLNASIVKDEESKTKVSEQLNVLNDKVKALNDSFSKLEQKKDGLISDIKNFEDNRKISKTNLAIIKEQLIDYEEMLFDKESEAKLIIKEIKRLNQDLNNVESIIVEKNKLIHDLNIDRNDLIKQNDSIKDYIAEEKMKLEKDKQDFVDSISKKEADLNKREGELSISIERLKTKTDSLRDAKEKLQIFYNKSINIII